MVFRIPAAKFGDRTKIKPQLFLSIQTVYTMRRPYLGVKGLLPATGVQIPEYIFRLPHAAPLGCTSGANVQVY